MTGVVGQTIIRVTEQSQVAEARRTAALLTVDSGFTATELGQIAVIVTELATNLVKHAKDGRLAMRQLDQQGAIGFEVVSLDAGPGMADVTRALEDGFSTAGSPGNGLGAIARTASEWDLHSVRGKGTAIVARLWHRQRSVPVSTQGRVGIMQQPMPGETVCGDEWMANESPDGWLCAIADGLGHGPDAARAASASLAGVKRGGRADVCTLMKDAHEAAKPTRGAALGIAQCTDGQVRFAGIGNIAAVVLDQDQRRTLISSNGILGHNVHKFMEVTHSWKPGTLLIMHSDGLVSHWTLNEYPGLLARDPTLIAAVLFRDFTRGRDDVTVLVRS